jgi:hypothetical protein
MESTRQDRVARDALAALPIRLRTPYVMRRMADASDRDISEALRVPRARVAKRLLRAEERIQRSFEDAGYGAVAMHATLDAYLTLPPAADFVPRVMAAIRQLPRHPGAASAANPSRRQRRLDRLTMAVVSLVLASVLLYLAHVAKSVLTNALAH